MVSRRQPNGFFLKFLTFVYIVSFWVVLAVLGFAAPVDTQMARASLGMSSS